MESEWWPRYSHSVKPAFELLAQDVDDRNDSFRYERFVGRASFLETLKFAARQPDARFIYIACHGSSGALHFPDKSKISVTDLNAALEQVNTGTRIDGVFLGSCLVGRDETAKRLLTSKVAAPQRIKWVAGYCRTVDWFDATLLDALFLRTILQVGDTVTPARRVRHAVNNIGASMAELSHRSGFSVFVRQPHTGKVINIVESNFEDYEIEP